MGISRSNRNKGAGPILDAALINIWLRVCKGEPVNFLAMD